MTTNEPTLTYNRLRNLKHVPKNNGKVIFRHSIFLDVVDWHESKKKLTKRQILIARHYWGLDGFDAKSQQEIADEGLIPYNTESDYFPHTRLTNNGLSRHSINREIALIYEDLVPNEGKKISSLRRAKAKPSTSLNHREEVLIEPLLPTS